MLSTEGSALADLLLERHAVICLAAELDVHLDLLAAVDYVSDVCDQAIDRVIVKDLRDTAAAERASVPRLLEALDRCMDAARRRLDEVSGELRP